MENEKKPHRTFFAGEEFRCHSQPCSVQGNPGGHRSHFDDAMSQGQSVLLFVSPLKAEKHKNCETNTTTSGCRPAAQDPDSTPSNRHKLMNETYRTEVTSCSVGQ